MFSENQFLECEPSLLKDKLRLLEDIPKQDVTNVFQNSYVLQKPLPGFCFKIWKENSNKKVFINICHLEVLPEPPSVTEDMANLEEYRVPMSVGDIRYETDQNGKEAVVIDVAFNPNFCKTASKDFFLGIVKVAIKDKYNIDLSSDVVILKNKKCYGDLSLHRIKKQIVDEHLGLVPKKEPLIKDISNKVCASENHRMKTPEFKVFKQESDISTLIAEIRLPYVKSSKEFILNVGDDRIIVESKNGDYFLDTFFPCFVNPEEIIAKFYKDSKILMVQMKVNDKDF